MSVHRKYLAGMASLLLVSGGCCPLPLWLVPVDKNPPPNLVVNQNGWRAVAFTEDDFVVVHANQGLTTDIPGKTGIYRVRDMAGVMLPAREVEKIRLGSRILAGERMALVGVLPVIRDDEDEFDLWVYRRWTNTDQLNLLGQRVRRAVRREPEVQHTLKDLGIRQERP